MAVVRVRGEVDTATAPHVGGLVDAQLDHGRRVVLDVRDVQFMDLHGLAVLMRASRRARRDGGSFSLAHPAPCVTRLLELVRAGGAIEIVPDGSDPLHAA